MSKNFHQKYVQEEHPLPSERSTGIVFAIVFIVIAYFWRSNTNVLATTLSISAVFAAVSIIKPIILRPLNKVWMRFALLLSRVMNPLIMFVLFAVLIVPAGLIMRIWYNPLKPYRQSDAKTYWIDRENNMSSNFKNQF